MDRWMDQKFTCLYKLYLKIADSRSQNGCVELVVIIKNISHWIIEITVYHKQNSTSCGLLKKFFMLSKSSFASNFMRSASHAIEYKESQKSSMTAHFLLKPIWIQNRQRLTFLKFFVTNSKKTKSCYINPIFHGHVIEMKQN